MRYRIKKETKPTLPTYGKYKAVAVHYQTIDSRQIAEEATRGMTISAGVLEGILMNVAEVVRRSSEASSKKWRQSAPEGYRAAETGDRE